MRACVRTCHFGRLWLLLTLLTLLSLLLSLLLLKRLAMLRLPMLRHKTEPNRIKPRNLHEH
ncbi:uncharacterized protein K452DRAFT_77148 [Aplosporella prunicola CBS 121167]|uniref:Uncharacterized protein n=1 Tax=Aplosporella prunicola CBS 121167 TaxID=1176127 RepID=A0A6A6B5J3_9PEZI|nr:uncharacterized protein K452DRAFT_77148 [Aplosporella prunicola CBS 121167]KAF2139412.1 hypothetical protein K452DRAFT_77148 [Aplosporella prunicola CBS 121167]